jgi:hypothetical protein
VFGKNNSADYEIILLVFFLNKEEEKNFFLFGFIVARSIKFNRKKQ